MDVDPPVRDDSVRPPIDEAAAANADSFEESFQAYEAGTEAVEPPADMMSALSDPPTIGAEAYADVDDAGRRRTPIWVWSGWLVLMLLVVGTALALLFMRPQLVAAWPPIERLYTITDAAKEAMLSSEPEMLVQIAVTSSKLDSSTGQRRMILTLTATSQADRHLSIPPARITLLDAQGAEIKTVAVRLPGKPLSPRESREVSLVLDDVPETLSFVRGEALPPQ